MAIFLSTFVNKLDKKGRVSVPVQFRKALGHEGFNGFIAFRSYKSPAIEAFPYERMLQLSQSVDELAVFSDDQQDLMATIFADAVQLPFDQDGRVILPEILVDHAHIQSQVAFVGCGASFQMWDHEGFARHQEEARKRLKEKNLSFLLTGKKKAPPYNEGDS